MKIAIVTGASSGMGREMVYELADRFAGLEEIWVIARRKDRLDAFDGKVPVRIRKLILDLTKDSELSILDSVLKRRKPEVKLLVNAAGLGICGSVEKARKGESVRMADLNVRALTAVTELVLPYVSDNSRIIQFASAAAFMPQPGFAVYAATKAYVLSYSRALNAELTGRRIFVTAVCPGPVDTEFFDTALSGGTLAPYKKLFLMKPKAVVKCALTDSLKGKELSIPGASMKLFYALCRLVPHRLLMRFITW